MTAFALLPTHPTTSFSTEPTPVPSPLQLVMDSEGFEANEYECPAGIATIGYGETNSNIKHITEAEARERLGHRWMQARTQVRLLVTTDISDNQINALTSFIDNVGTTKFRRSTMLKYLNAGRHDLAAKEFDKWVYAKNRKLQGLVIRRAKEKELFLS